MVSTKFYTLQKWALNVEMCDKFIVVGLTRAVSIREQLRKMLQRFKVKLVSCGCKLW